MGHRLTLDIIDHLPEGLLDSSPEELAEVLRGPTLMHLPGRRPEPVFASVLLHGNEDTGLRAVQAVLREYAGRQLPRAFSVFIGNVAAARTGLRMLENQPDFNRVWPGTETADTPYHAIAEQVVEEMRCRGVFAAVDIHNNTGVNPYYACVTRLDPRSLQLATLFSRTVVYFTRPLGVVTAAFAPLAPSVALECGKVRQGASVAEVARYLDACLHAAEIPDHTVPEHDLDLYHTVATVTVPSTLAFSFGDGDGDAPLRFPGDLDHLNFRELPAGTALAEAPGARAVPLVVRDESGADATGAFLVMEDGEIRLRRPVIPAMLTLDERVIQQDCLGYLMERLPYP
jgi:succinylglutamate desuccinylase